MPWQIGNDAIMMSLMIAHAACGMCAAALSHTIFKTILNVTSLDRYWNTVSVQCSRGPGTRCSTYWILTHESIIKFRVAIRHTASIVSIMLLKAILRKKKVLSVELRSRDILQCLRRMKYKSDERWRVITSWVMEPVEFRYRKFVVRLNVDIE